MNLPIEVDVNAYGIGDTPIVVGNILSLGKLFLHLVVLREVLHNAHLCRLLSLNKAFIVATSELLQSLLSDDTQVVAII